jgi:hypothetical protein
MRKTLLGTLALGAVVSLSVTTPAHATDPQGRKCTFTSNTDNTAEEDTQIGYIQGGPLELPDGGGTLNCNLLVNGAPTTANATGHSVGAGPVNVVEAHEAPISYHATPTDVVSLCTSITYDAGGTIYWHPDPLVPGLGTWNGDSTDCGLATSVDLNPQVCPVLLAIDARAGTPLAETWQDCGPYDPIV